MTGLPRCPDEAKSESESEKGKEGKVDSNQNRNPMEELMRQKSHIGQDSNQSRGQQKELMTWRNLGGEDHRLSLKMGQDKESVILQSLGRISL